MKLTCLLSALVLALCLSVAGQQTPAAPPPPNSANPSSLPQDQRPAGPENMPPDSAAPNPVDKIMDQQETGSLSTGKETTLRGCLSQSGDSFTLTNRWGTAYQLQGDSARLGQHLGQFVEVAGKSVGTGNRAHTSTSEPMTSATNSSPQTVVVADVRKLSDDCKGR